ncbi:NTPase KAP [Marinomonas sp. A3A]|uniref:KAP family P-loop NTPase fold protein n=1 Tax=Marinomonas sp. A3A TaxID=2065312 RepID=UPI001BB402BB|nr:P-loop NTPase fold protein [Marinomonas sp. A3A]QUX90256.1 NTPase KAP [Marinomonas sp. A3A]
MQKNISLDWSKKLEFDGESFPKDTLNRAKYAEFLTQFLVGQGYDTTRESGDEKRNYVLNLNSEWGSGKTYFLKRWSNDLKAHFPVVYIDAWQQDYSDDPLMTVISSVIKQLRDQAGMSESNPKFQLPKKALGLLKAAAPGFARSVAKRYLDIDLAALMQGEEPDIQDENGLPIDMGELASTMVKQLIDEHDGKKKAIDDLKAHVKKWVETVTAKQKLNYPAFIFIDELDRCRPSYAVEMLETIKHIFDIQGIVFVVATDTEQLQHAVKAIYGEGFDARLYLGRFFNSRFSLKAPDLKSFLEVHTDISKLSGEYLKKAGIQILPPNDDASITLSNISVILDAFKMPPRTAIQIADRVVATISNMPKGAKIDILMLTTLLCFYEEDNELFRKVVSGKLEYKDNKDKDLGLNGYIENRFENCESVIEMRINPKEHIPVLSPSKYRPRENKFGKDTYKFLFKEYLKYCFLELFSKNSIGIYLLLRDSGQAKENPITNLFDQLTSKNHTSLEIGLLWFKILRCHYGVDSISSGQYQDYVELASALDLIEEEPKNG